MRKTLVGQHMDNFELSGIEITKKWTEFTQVVLYKKSIPIDIYINTSSTYKMAVKQPHALINYTIALS